MAENKNQNSSRGNNNSDRSNNSSDRNSSEAKKHEAYSQMGHLGGEKRAEQMAREGFHPKDENQSQSK